jgi:S-DNA-T family DNA segregation ATPase FtsK/SpoIIIE
MIISLISKYGPDQLRFVIIDPKQVDFELFRELPHMMFNTIIDNDLALCNSTLQWAVDEMERRYSELKLSKSKNISDYNRMAVQNKERIMPRIVLIIDEFADLMLRDKKGIGEKICLIAQKSRAAGIHLVLAAQRPSADIVNGPIKANLPARLVFRASSHVDSSVSLGEPGAEKLLGKGDCLYKTGGMLNTERAMGAYLSDDEVSEIVEYVAEKNVAYYDHNSWTKIKARCNAETNEVEMASVGNAGSVATGKSTGGVDQVYVDAMRIGFDFDGLSVSFLQRKLGLGYPRAAKVVDWLTDNGYISSESVKGKRKMIISREEYEEKFCGGASSDENEE